MLRTEQDRRGNSTLPTGHTTGAPKLFLGRSTRAQQRGSALMLVPALMLVFFVLAGMAIDLSIIHLAHRSTHRIVSAAADDAAGMIDHRQLQLDGNLQIDPSAAQRVVLAHLSAAKLPGRLTEPPEILVSPDRLSIEVRVSLIVEHVVIKAVPGSSDHELLTVSASAQLLP